MEGLCYFATDEKVPYSEANDACKEIDERSSIAEVKRKDLQFTLMDMIRSRPKLARVKNFGDFHIGGTYNVSVMYIINF